MGESEGHYLSMGFDDETSDAAAALAALRRIDGVDRSRVGVVGHSVGATIAIRLAASERGVTAAVLLCAAASCGRDVMSWQSARIAATLPGPDWLAPRSMRRRQQRDRERLATSTEASLRLHRSPLPAGWFREYMAYDPAVDLAAIRCPVRAVTGAKDLQVDAADVTRIGFLVAGPFTGQTPEHLTHLLRSASAGRRSAATGSCSPSRWTRSCSARSRRGRSSTWGRSTRLDFKSTSNVILARCRWTSAIGWRWRARCRGSSRGAPSVGRRSAGSAPSPARTGGR